MSRRTVQLVVGVLALVSYFQVCLPGCNSSPGQKSAPPVIQPISASAHSGPAPASFTDISDQAGIAFRHFNGTFGKKWMPETTGGGGAFIDFDRDGKEDV